MLLYEMLTGIPPFYSKNRRTTYQMILNSQLTFPPFLSQQVLLSAIITPHLLCSACQLRCPPCFHDEL